MWPSRQGQKTRYLAPVTERPVMNAPARVGVMPAISTKVGACARATMTAACAETSTCCPRPVRARAASAVSAPMAAWPPTQA